MSRISRRDLFKAGAAAGLGAALPIASAKPPGGPQSGGDDLTLVTRNAWFLRMEDKIGSIEEGKLGDLLVLNHDYFAVSDEDIKKTHPVLTVVGGKIVHDTGAL